MIDQFGFTMLGDWRLAVMGVTFLLSLMVLALFIIAMAGWSEEYETLVTAKWAESNGVNYYGLKGYISGAGTINDFISWASCADISVGCKVCSDAGKITLGLLLVSFFLLLGVAVGSCVRGFQDPPHLKLVMVFLTFSSWILSVAAYGHWNQECYISIGDYGAPKLEHSDGFACAVAGWAIINLLFFFHLFTPVTKYGIDLSSK